MPNRKYPGAVKIALLIVGTAVVWWVAYCVNEALLGAIAAGGQ